MHNLKALRLAVLFLLGGLSFGTMGCDSSDPDTSPSIGGAYMGTETYEGTTSTIRLDIPGTRSGSFDFVGQISVREEGVTVSFDAAGNGTYDHPDITMNVTVEAAGTQNSVQWSGTVSTSGDILTLSAAGGPQFRLTRQ